MKKAMMVLALALTMTGCATLKDPETTENVIDYSVAQHGLFVDEIIPIARLTGVHQGDGYKFYFDTANQKPWTKEYAQYCRLHHGSVVTDGRSRDPISCVKDQTVLFTWLSAASTLSHVSRFGDPVVSAHKKYFLVLMPTTRQMTVSEAEKKTISYYKQLVKMK